MYLENYQKIASFRTLNLDEGEEELGLELGIGNDEGLSATDEGGKQDENNLEGESARLDRWGRGKSGEEGMEKDGNKE